jgi:hypothetical protein
MSKTSTQFEILVSKLKADSDKLELGLSEELIIETAKDLGISAFNADSKFVDSKSDEELKTIKNDFLIKKLKLVDDSKLDDAILSVLERLKALKNKKHRVLVYALLKTHFAKISNEVKTEIKEEVIETKSFFDSVKTKVKNYLTKLGF